ncbi:MAG TPA: hypothetical protein VGJ28_23135 [Micromonosporaceae bacterium]
MTSARSAALLSMVVLAACSGSAPKLTGLGGSKAAFGQHRGSEYSSIGTDKDGRVTGYILTTQPRSLAQAEAAVRKDLPSDATGSAPRKLVGIEGTECEIVHFSSPTLGKVLGSADVLAVFQAENAIAMDTNRIVTSTVTSGVNAPPDRC